MDFSREAFDTQLDEIIKREQWIIDFPKNKLPKIYELLEKYQESKDIVIFKSRKEADDYLEQGLFPRLRLKRTVP